MEMERSTFEINVHDTPASLTLHLRGELDLATVDQIRDVVTARVDGQAGVTIDLSGLTFMDSTGIRLLLELNDQPDGPPVRYVEPSREVAPILDLTGIRHVLAWTEPPPSH
jgi:anti-anti-sigma factor